MLMVYDDNSRVYLSTKGKIILFVDEAEVQYFCGLFIRYCQQRLAAEGRLAELFNLPTFKTEKYDKRNLPEEKTILFSELKP